MTGKQRVEHGKWKAERQQFDQERIERAKSAQGSWKREWDSEKIAGGRCVSKHLHSALCFKGSTRVI